MRKYIFMIYMLILAPLLQAEINQSPDQTLVSTSIGTLHTIDSFLVSASDEGVSTFVYDETLKQYRFLQRTYIPSLNSVTSKLSDSVLVIKSQDEKLCFVSIKNLPALTLLGFVDLNRSYADYTFVDNSLYISGYYDGILRYTIQNYSTASFVDSSMTGILVTQLDHDNQYLYALDEYNGLLRYDLSVDGFGTFIDYLFVPFRAKAFTKVDSLFYLHLIRGGLLLGDFNLPAGNNIIDSIVDLQQVDCLISTDSLLIVADDRRLTTVNKFDYSDRTSYNVRTVSSQILENPFDNSLSFMMPSLYGGLSFVSLDVTLNITDGLTYNGTINDVFIDNSYIYMSNSTQPVNLYKIDSSGYTTADFTLYENLKNTGHMEHNGDSLFVMYPEFDKLAVIVHADEPDFALLENSITISSSQIREMYYSGEQLFDNALIFLEHPFNFEIYSVSDSGYLSYQIDWDFIADITSFAIKDSIAVVTDSKNNCNIYSITQNYDKSFLTSISLSGTASETIFNNNLLYLFEDRNMYVVNFADYDNIFVDTVLSIPIDVVDAAIVEDYMFTVGTKGITKFDLSGGLPEMVETGGLPGNYIDVDSNLIVVHDNKTVMLYYHNLDLTGQLLIKNDNNFADLAQNYPNPFNLETVISYTLSQKSEVQLSVYNILGQNVKTLVHTVQDAGNHSVTWDGKNFGGKTIASGIYLYKLQTGNSVSTKKMILLK